MDILLLNMFRFESMKLHPLHLRFKYINIYIVKMILNLDYSKTTNVRLSIVAVFEARGLRYLAFTLKKNQC